MDKKKIKKLSFDKKGSKYQLFLNDKPFLTPSKNEIILPLNLIKKIIEELNKEENNLVKETISVFSFCVTSIDKVLPNRGFINNEILNYFITDSLFYRENLNKDLKQEQQLQFDPIIKIFEKKLKVKISLSEYTIPVRQSYDANSKMLLFINKLNELELTGMLELVNISNSLILSYLLFNKMIGSDTFLSVSFLEENFQERKWGLDKDNVKKKSAVSKQLNEVLHFLELLN